MLARSRRLSPRVDSADGVLSRCARWCYSNHTHPGVVYAITG